MYKFKISYVNLSLCLIRNTISIELNKFAEMIQCLWSLATLATMHDIAFVHTAVQVKSLMPKAKVVVNRVTTLCLKQNLTKNKGTFDLDNY